MLDEKQKKKIEKLADKYCEDNGFNNKQGYIAGAEAEAEKATERMINFGNWVSKNYVSSPMNGIWFSLDHSSSYTTRELLQMFLINEELDHEY